jgi:hypothetical protein
MGRYHKWFKLFGLLFLHLKKQGVLLAVNIYSFVLSSLEEVMTDFDGSKGISKKKLTFNIHLEPVKWHGVLKHKQSGFVTVFCHL